MAQSLILATFLNGLLGVAMFVLSLFLILLILVQRGRGGGLTGALGGPGGQSAFGTKAGDLFTRITSFVALGWIALCAFTMWLLGPNLPTSEATTPAVTAAPTENTNAVKDLIDLGTPKPGDTAKPSDTAKPDDAAKPATDDAAAPATTPAAAPETTEAPADKPTDAASSTEPAAAETKPAESAAAETQPTTTEPAATEPAATEAAK